MKCREILRLSTCNHREAVSEFFLEKRTLDSVKVGVVMTACRHCRLTTQMLMPADSASLCYNADGAQALNAHNFDVDW